MTTVLSYPPLWRRFAAILYDTFLVTAVSMGYGGIGIGVGLALGDNAAISSTLGFQIGWLLVVLGFFCFFWMKAGQTLGMRAWRLGIVQEGTHKKPTLVQCVSRLILAPIGLGLFALPILRNDKQCLHDLASRTQVILLPKGS